MNNYFYNNNDIFESSFDLYSHYQTRRKNYFSLSNRKKKNIKIELLKSSSHNNSEEKNSFSQRNSIKPNPINYPIVITKKNHLKHEKLSENTLIQKVNNYYIDSSHINLTVSNNRKNILYKNKSDLFFEKLENKKKKNKKIPFNKASKIKIKSSITNYLNNYKKNNTESSVKNSVSNSLIKNNNNNCDKIYTIFQKKNKESPIIEFNEVLLNIFRIIQVYNNKNEYLKEEKVICKIKDELTEYYEETINTNLQEKEKTKIKVFSNEIFNLFKNKNNLIKKYENIIKKDNGENLKLQEIFKDSYAKNKINYLINNFYSLKTYKAGKIFSKKNNYENISSLLIEKFNKSLSPQNRILDKKNFFKIQKNKIFDNNKKKVNNHILFNSFSNNKQFDINTTCKRNNLITKGLIYDNKENSFEETFLKTEKNFSKTDNILNIRNKSDDKNFKQFDNNFSNECIKIGPNIFEQLNGKSEDNLNNTNIYNINNLENNSIIISNINNKNNLENINLNSNINNIKDYQISNLNSNNEKRDLILNKINNSKDNKNRKIIYNDSYNFNKFSNSKKNIINFSDDIDVNPNILHTQLSSLQKTETSFLKNIEEQNDKINIKELLIHENNKSLNKKPKNMFKKKNVTKLFKQNKNYQFEKKENNKINNKKQLKLNSDIESIKPINSFVNNIISDNENNNIENKKISFDGIEFSNKNDEKNNNNYNENKSILQNKTFQLSNNLFLKNLLKETENKNEKKEENENKKKEENENENKNINKEIIIEKKLKTFPKSFRNENKFKDEKFSYNSLYDDSISNDENNFGLIPNKGKKLSALIKAINQESNKINTLKKQKTKEKLLNHYLKELKLNNTTNSIENQEIEKEKNKNKNNLQFLDEKNNLSYKKKSYELMLKIKNDLSFYLSQDKWDYIERNKLNEFKKKIEKIQLSNIEDYINEIVDMKEEIEDWKAVREIEKRINTFKENLNEQISIYRLRREKLQNSFNLIDNIF